GEGAPRAVSRPDFVGLCHELTRADEAAFEDLWRRVGLSVDWTMTYTTIGERARRASQRGFLRLMQKGEVYSAEAPTLWDVDIQTAVAQAELEDREVDGAWYRLAFQGPEGPLEIETTRPELLAACVALVAHPDDARYAPLFGRTARTPVFGLDVPILPHQLAEPEKGTGVAMVCTFGDVTDVVWWRELGLALRPVMGRDGRLVAVRFGEQGWEAADPAVAQVAYDRLAGRTAVAARREMAALASEAGALVGEPRPLRHAVKHYERGRRPLEIVTSRQWFIRLLDHREALKSRGAELSWHPSFMAARYEAWVAGLSSDWNLSRQRYFGVPFPLWYPLDDQGRVEHSRPLLASEDRLPVDPSTDVPAGYDPEQRGRPGGFVGDPDVMDTWATSSLTPQLAAGWEEDPDLFSRVFPMDLRPQGQDIIRTWLFYTVARAELAHGELPWRHAAISGFIVDPDRKKMSKSKGNVVTPAALLAEHGTDAVRYWAACGRPGADTVADPAQMRVGRRLAIKILNASRFVLSLGDGEPGVREGGRGDAGMPGGGSIGEPGGGSIGEPGSPAGAGPAPLRALDVAILHTLADLVETATSALEAYDYARALERTEAFFWSFCDDYLELVKTRAYGSDDADGPAGRRAALACLEAVLSVLLRLFAPFLPFVTEEVWSWWQAGSVHRAAWPEPGPLRHAAGPGASSLSLEVASEVLGRVRRAKTESRLSMRAPVRRVSVVDSPERLEAVSLARRDLSDAGSIDELELVEGASASVTVELGPTPGRGL
ncbi:MAG: valine--tRNA ligase, partial [Acidimicrobiales bacterium]